jgi:hypothetical protein
VYLQDDTQQSFRMIGIEITPHAMFQCMSSMLMCQKTHVREGFACLFATFGYGHAAFTINVCEECHIICMTWPLVFICQFVQKTHITTTPNPLCSHAQFQK